MVANPRHLTLSRCHQPPTKTHQKVGVHRPFEDLKAHRALGAHPRDHMGRDRMRREPDQRRFTLAGILPIMRAVLAPSCLLPPTYLGRLRVGLGLDRWVRLIQPTVHVSRTQFIGCAQRRLRRQPPQRQVVADGSSPGEHRVVVRSVPERPGGFRGRRSASMAGSGRSRAVSSGVPDRHSGVARPLRGGLAHRT